MPPQQKQNVSPSDAQSLSAEPYRGSYAAVGGVAAVTDAAAATKKDNLLLRLLSRADVVLAILLVLGALGLFWALSRGDSGEAADSARAIAERYGSVELPLQDFAVGADGVDLEGQRVVVNGTLQANGQLLANSSIIVSPSPAPANPTAGQIYFDQTGGVMSYWDGTEFVPMGGVTSVQGSAGDVTLVGAGGITIATDGAGGIILTGPDIPAPASGGVTSLNGLSGGVAVNNSTAAGSSITINDASTAAKGIAQFNATNFTVSGGVVNTVQNINVAATPTFAGVNTNLVQAAGNLQLQSGGNVLVGTPDATGTLLVLDTKTTAGDPVGVDGAMYYNSATGNFRCFQGGTWTNCITASGGFVSLQNAYDNSTPAVINLNSTNAGILVRDTAGGIGGNLFAVQNSDGSSTYLGVTTGGINVGGSATVTGNTTVQGGNITVGTASTAGQVVLHAGNAFAGTLQVVALGQDVVYTLPDPSQATATICLSTGNCAGTGGGVTTGGGTPNRLAKFTTDQNIEDSTITDDGATVTTSVNMVVQGGSLTVGQAGSTGNLTLVNTNGNSTTLQAGAAAGNLTFILPTGAGNQWECLKKDTGDQLIWDDCEGGGGGVTTTLQQAYSAYGVNPAIVTLNSDANGIIIRDAAPGIGSSLLVVQDNTGSASYFDLTASQLALGDASTNTNLILQGPSSYISNPQGFSGSESFGIDASIQGTDSLAIGNGATAGGTSGSSQGIAIGAGAFVENSAVIIGVNARSLDTNGSGAVAVGNGSEVSQFGVAIGGGASGGFSGVAIGSASAAASFSVAIGDQAQATGGNTSIAIGIGSSTTAGNQLVIGGAASAGDNITQAYLGSGVTDTAPEDITLNATGGSGTNLQGASFTLAGGRSTGNAAGGNINFQVTLPGSSGSTQNSFVTALNISGSTGAVSLGTSESLSGQLSFRNATNTNTITLQTVAATANRTITLPDASGTICLTSGNCAGVGGNGDVLQGGNIFADTMSIGTNDNFALNLRTNGTTRMTVAADGSAVTLSENTNLLLQGATAYISNQQGLTNSEVFGLDASATNQNQVVIGNAAFGRGNRSVTIGRLAGTATPVAGACNDFIMIGFNVECANSGGVAIGSGASSISGIAVGMGAVAHNNNAIAIGSDASTNQGAIRIGSGPSSAGTWSVAIGQNVSAGSMSVAIGRNANANANSIAIGANATTTGSNQLVIGSSTEAITTAFIGSGINDTNPQSVTLRATNAATGQTNLQGASFTLASGRSTGNAAGGNINFQVTLPGSSGSTQNSFVTALNISGSTGAVSLGTSGPSGLTGQLSFRNASNGNTVTLQSGTTSSSYVLTLPTGLGSAGQCLSNTGGGVLGWSDCGGGGGFSQGGDSFGADAVLGTTDNFSLDILTNNEVVANFSNSGATTLQNTSNSASAFRVLNATDVPLFQIDTTTNRVYVGNPTADSTGALLVLDTKNTAGDPDGVDGGMYYNSDVGRFRCYEAGSWRDCIGGAPEEVVFTSDGTFSKADYPGARAVLVKVQAGGGAGGWTEEPGSGQATAGSGGSGGNYAESWFDVGVLPSSVAVTVGAGGDGGVGITGPERHGGNSSFGSLVTASGGRLGWADSIASATRVSEGGRALTTGNLGDKIVRGGGGEGALSEPGWAIGGVGGDSYLGAGGGSYGTRFNNDLSSGQPGGGFGGGGGGAVSVCGSCGQIAGGDGAPGVVIIYVYY